MKFIEDSSEIQNVVLEVEKIKKENAESKKLMGQIDKKYDDRLQILQESVSENASAIDTVQKNLLEAIEKSSTAQTSKIDATNEEIGNIKTKVNKNIKLILDDIEDLKVKVSEQPKVDKSAESHDSAKLNELRTEFKTSVQDLNNRIQESNDETKERILNCVQETQRIEKKVDALEKSKQNESDTVSFLDEIRNQEENKHQMHQREIKNIQKDITEAKGEVTNIKKEVETQKRLIQTTDSRVEELNKEFAKLSEYSSKGGASQFQESPKAESKFILSEQAEQVLLPFPEDLEEDKNDNKAGQDEQDDQDDQVEQNDQADQVLLPFPSDYSPRDDRPLQKQESNSSADLNRDHAFQIPDDVLYEPNVRSGITGSVFSAINKGKESKMFVFICV